MKASILYIRENELKPDFQERLRSMSNDIDVLYVIVQLQPSTIDFQPLIGNFIKDIRIKKLKNKIKNWYSHSSNNSYRLKLKVIDNSLRDYISSFDFSEVSKLDVYVADGERESLLSILKKYFKAENLQFYTF